MASAAQSEFVFAEQSPEPNGEQLAQNGNGLYPNGYGNGEIPSVTPIPNPAISQVDWSFIAAQEGGLRTDGYIPKLNNTTGITIGAGVDLGSVTVDDLVSWGASQDLINTLSPYLGLKGADAQAYLNNPSDPSSGLSTNLLISTSDALLLTQGAGMRTIVGLETAYYNATGQDFDALPAAEQTVTADVAFQTGQAGLENHFANGTFWNQVINNDWQGAQNTLATMPTQYYYRRQAEANLLGNYLKGQ